MDVERYGGVREPALSVPAVAFVIPTLNEAVTLSGLLHDLTRCAVDFEGGDDERNRRHTQGRLPNTAVSFNVQS